MIKEHYGEIIVTVLACLSFLFLSTAMSYEGENFVLPYFPAANDQSEEGSFSINSRTDTGGVATLTFYEQDGDKGTVDLTFPGRGMHSATLADILPDIVPDSANKGTLGDSVSFINVSCDFTGNGFGMIFTDVDGVGVTSSFDCNAFTFPYLVPMNSEHADGWWGMVSIYNNTETDGAAKLTIYEQDGDKGTAVVAVRAYGIYDTTLTDLLSTIVPDSGNKGTLGDAHGFMNVSCDFNGNGFGIIGNETCKIGMPATLNRSSFSLPYLISGIEGWSSSFSIYNNTVIDGTATITICDASGYMETFEIPIAARSIYINTPSALTSDLSPGPCFMDVSCDFNGGGFGMLGFDGMGAGVVATSAHTTFTFPYITSGLEDISGWSTGIAIYNNNNRQEGTVILEMYDAEGKMAAYQRMFQFEREYWAFVLDDYILTDFLGMDTISPGPGFMSVSSDNFKGGGSHL